MYSLEGKNEKRDGVKSPAKSEGAGADLIAIVFFIFSLLETKLGERKES